LSFAEFIAYLQYSQPSHSARHRFTKAMLQAFITSRLDSSNALYCGITDDLIRRLQSSRHKTLPLGWCWWRALGATASRQFSTSCIGFQCGSASSWR